jgi:hypothetical protein
VLVALHRSLEEAKRAASLTISAFADTPTRRHADTGICGLLEFRAGSPYDASQPRYDRAENAGLTFAYFDLGSRRVIHDQ